MTPAERTELKANAAALGVILDDPSIERIGGFLDLLEVWNQRFRLTGDRERATLLRKHVVDCLAVVPDLPPDGPVLDIGSGAGFPGLVLACAHPQQEVVLVEPRRRPTSFLLEVIRTIGLPNVRVFEGRAETAAGDPSYRRQMALVISRAVKLDQLLELAPPFLRGNDGVLLAMQSTSLSEHAVRATARDAGMELVGRRDYRLPDGEARCLLSFRQSHSFGQP